MSRVPYWKFKEKLRSKGANVSDEDAKNAWRQFNSNNGNIHGTGINEKISKIVNEDSDIGNEPPNVNWDLFRY